MMSFPAIWATITVMRTITDEIREELMSLRDAGYRDLQCRILPTVDPQTIIGVRTPDLRRLVKQFVKRADVEDFLGELPHTCFDENQLHAFILSEIRDFTECVDSVSWFLPYIDNWATCDQLSPKVFARHREELLPRIREWIADGRTYTVRFGVGMLMQHYLDDAFDPAYPSLAAGIRSDEYYVRMMVAWYFATALAKQYDAVIPFLQQKKLDTWTHNKTIQKAVESYRITPEQKDYLKSLRIR